MEAASMTSSSFELKEPILRIDGMKESVTDGELAELLYECMPMRPSIIRSGDLTACATGQIEFKTVRIAEKALATFHGIQIPSDGSRLALHPVTPLAAPVNSVSLLLQGLSASMTTGGIFDLLRNYGPLITVKLEDVVGEATVTFYQREDALKAQNELHGSQLAGNTIRLQEQKVKVNKSEGSVTTPSPLIGLGLPRSSSMRAMAASFSPYIPIPRAIPFQSITNSSDLVDPCNLFIKALDPSIDSNDLFTLFEPFGKITSARVMKDESGISKRFGFVCFTTTEAAATALEDMNGRRMDGSKSRGLIVRFHEPKAHRIKEEEKVDVIIPLIPRAPLRSVSATSGMSETARFVLAVSRIDSTRTKEVVELLLGLTKKARAQCLFNPEYMEEKVIEAMEVLDSLEDEPEPVTNHFKQQDLPPATPIREYLPTPNSTPQFPSLSTLSIAPITSPITSPISTPRSLKLAEIASLPAYEIIELVKSLSLESVGISPVSAELEQDIDTFIDTLTGKDSQKSKQALGERLFKVLKFFGIKGAPRITIELLDTEPLRPLAHLINYPDILRAKATAVLML